MDIRTGLPADPVVTLYNWTRSPYYEIHVLL